MMLHTFVFVICISLLGSVTKGQDTCAPLPVVNIQLSDAILSWQAAEDVNCPATEYLVYILRFGTINYVYSVQNPLLDIFFLSVCTEYTFTIYSISGHTLGSASNFTAITGPPAGANYTIPAINVSEIENGFAVVWNVDDSIENCVDSYRVVIWEDDVPNDFYVTDTNYTATDLIPCTNYTIKISAIVSKEEGPISSVELTAPAAVPSPPVWSVIRSSSRSINSSWHFQSYSQNRCPLVELAVEATLYFNKTFAIEDSPNRPLYTLNLTDLNPNTVYLTHVSLVNTAGPSSPTVVPFQTLTEMSSFEIDIEN